MGLEWSHRKKRGKEGGRGGVSVESWTEGKKEGVRVESWKEGKEWDRVGSWKEQKEGEGRVALEGSRGKNMGKKRGRQSGECGVMERREDGEEERVGFRVESWKEGREGGRTG